MDNKTTTRRALRRSRDKMNATKHPIRGFALFLAASLITFGCLMALQFLEKPWFFMALVAMHGGIALFVISKRTLCKQGFNLKRYFKMEYAMLLPFLLIMIYSLLSKAGALPPFGTAKASITLVYALICFAVAFWNFRRMQRDARSQTATNPRGDEAVVRAANLVAE